jgi:hypothetical protein
MTVAFDPGPGPKPDGTTHPTPTRPPGSGHQPASCPICVGTGTYFSEEAGDDAGEMVVCVTCCGSGRLATPTPVPSDAAVRPPVGAGANHPRLTGECRTPGYAAAAATAARESVELPLGAGASHRHEPDRPTAPGLPPRPIDYPRPQPKPRLMMGGSR